MLGCILFILRWNDASTSQTAIAQILWFAGADHVLAIKCNQPHLHTGGGRGLRGRQAGH